MSVKFNTPVARLSYPHLFQPKAISKGAEPKFSACLIFDPKDEDFLKSKIIEAAQEKYGDKAVEMLRTKKLKNILRKGDEDRSDDPAFAGKFFLNAYAKEKPEIVDRHLNIITDPKRVYAGVFVRANIALYAYEAEGGKGIAAGLNGLQLVREGERIDGRTSAKAAFADGADLGPEDESDSGSGGAATTGKVDW